MPTSLQVEWGNTKAGAVLLPFQKSEWKLTVRTLFSMGRKDVTVNTHYLRVWIIPGAIYFHSDHWSRSLKIITRQLKLPPIPSSKFCKCQKLQELPKDGWIFSLNASSIKTRFLQCFVHRQVSRFWQTVLKWGAEQGAHFKVYQFLTTRNDIFQTSTPSPSVRRTMLQHTSSKVEGCP